MSAIRKTFVADLHQHIGTAVTLRGWIYHLRVLAKTSFVILKDCSGETQCVAATDALRGLHLKLDDAVEIRGVVRRDERAKQGTEIDIQSVEILNRCANVLPFNSSSNTVHIGSDLLLEYRPLALRSEHVGNVFRIQAAILKYFRELDLASRLFDSRMSAVTATVTSCLEMVAKLEIRSNLFAIEIWGQTTRSLISIK